MSFTEFAQVDSPSGLVGLSMDLATSIKTKKYTKKYVHSCLGLLICDEISALLCRKAEA